MPPRNARVHRKVPVAFTASTRFQSSSEVFATGALCATPALLTRMSTLPAFRVTALTRSATLAASVTSHGTAHALPPRPRISVATCSMRSVRRAATTTAAPSAASAFATAAPMPWPPPVTTATAPSNLRKHGLLEDRTQRVNETRALAGGGRGGVAKVSAWTTGFLERSFARADRVGERGRVGRQSAPDRLADGRGTLAEDDRALELARVTRAAEAGRGIGERWQNHAVIPPCREPLGSRSGHGTGDQDVGLEREMRPVRFDGSDGQYR